MTKSKAGRPLGFKRKTSIEGAMNLFWKQGVAAVTTLLLAEGMGIQRSSFYNTFGNKEAVFKEVLEHYESISPDRWLLVIKPADPVMPQLKGYFKELCKVRAADIERRGCLFCNSVTELAGQESELGQILSSALLERVNLLDKLFEQAEAQGEIREGSYTDDMAMSFVIFILGLNTLAKVVTSEERLWETCETYLQGLGL